MPELQPTGWSGPSPPRTLKPNPDSWFLLMNTSRSLVLGAAEGREEWRDTGVMVFVDYVLLCNVYIVWWSVRQWMNRLYHFRRYFWDNRGIQTSIVKRSCGKYYDIFKNSHADRINDWNKLKLSSSIQDHVVTVTSGRSPGFNRVPRGVTYKHSFYCVNLRLLSSKALDLM